jgi:hypothetical protein
VLGARRETTRSTRVAVVMAIVGAISWKLLGVLGSFFLGMLSSCGCGGDAYCYVTCLWSVMSSVRVVFVLC